jgi:aminoglycoside phosphotransferase (APT) family kinase protein
LSRPSVSAGKILNGPTGDSLDIKCVLRYVCLPMPSSATERSDVAAVRRGEELDVASLAEYLRGKLEGAESGIEVKQFRSGHSNLTYLVAADRNEYVLRRGPLGPVPPKAHDMAREYQVLRAVHPHFPEAPKVFHLCEDPSVIGTLFYVMERRQGIILRDRVPPEIEGLPNHGRMISEAFVDCLVRLHAVDVPSAGLLTLGKPEGFLERQVRGWTDRWQRSKTQDLQEMEEVIEWLSKSLPASAPATLLHNDYKLDNVMLSADSPARIEAVLDWEMATIGDPLVDLGLTLCYWSWAAARELGSHGVKALTSHPGWYTREELIARYSERTLRDPTHIAYYETLGIFKLAVILQQIYYRFHRGQTSDVRFRDFDARVKGLARLAASLVERNG